MPKNAGCAVKHPGYKPSPLELAEEAAYRLLGPGHPEAAARVAREVVDQLALLYFFKIRPQNETLRLELPRTRKIEIIRDARKRLKLTQAALSRLFGVTPSSVSYWESGRHDVPDWAIAKALRLTRAP